MTVDGPPDDASTECVENDGAIHPALTSRVLGELGDPELIATTPRELTAHVIPGGRDVRHTSVARSTGESLQARTAHQKLDSLTAYRDPEPQSEFDMDSSCAIDASRVGMRANDPLRQPRVPEGPRRRRAVQPFVVPRHGNAENSAGQFDR